VTAGVSYSIAVDASTPTHATVSFRLLPANDNLSDASLLALTPGTVVTDTLRGATRESGETEHGAGPTAVSAWYRVHVDTAHGPPHRLPALCRQRQRGAARRLHGQIADRGGEGSVVEVGHAGREPGEPQHAGESGGHSLWWSYTPTTDRVVDVHACAEQGDPLVAAYTGASVDALTIVAIGVQKQAHHCADLTFTARAGVTYRIALDVEGAAAGSMRLTLSPRLPDHTSFAAAQPLAIPASILDEFAGPQPEPGEPAHANLAGSGRSGFG
jgi:hypothetical protein